MKFNEYLKLKTPIKENLDKFISQNLKFAYHDTNEKYIEITYLSKLNDFENIMSNLIDYCVSKNIMIHISTNAIDKEIKRPYIKFLKEHGFKSNNVKNKNHEYKCDLILYP